MNIIELKRVASQIRRDIIRMVNSANSGHPGGSLSSTDFITALFFEVMKHNPKEWTLDGRNSDIFFLSAGHLTPLYYSILARCGYFDVKELSDFRKFGSRLQGHPSAEWHLPGIHISTGSLGQGLSVACGAAAAKRVNKDPNFVYVLVGDGESEEGQIWEAALWGAQHKLSKIIAITDWNGQQIDGPVSTVLNLGDLKSKWEAFGWECFVADGHDFDSILSAYNSAKSGADNGKPKMILMKSNMGQGVDFMSGTHHWHGKAPNSEQTVKALGQLEETLGDF